MSIDTTYYNNEAVFSFTSETAFTLPSYNSRAVITLKNLSVPALTCTCFGSETVDGASTLTVGGGATVKIVKGESGWVIVEGADSPDASIYTNTNTTEATIAGAGALVLSGGIYAAKKIITATGTVALGGNSLVQSIVGNATVTNDTAAGSAFTNQPANDGVEIVSDNAADTTQTATVIGTTTGTDTLVSEDVVLTGTTAVPTVKVDWGVILAVKLSASCAGTVTFREASGNATIVTLATTVLSAGVNTAANTTAFNKVLSVVASGATTKQVGWKGTNSAGTVIYDSQALSGTTAVLSNSVFQTVTEIYSGDIEASRTTTTSQGLSGPDYAGTTTNDDAQAGKIGERKTGQLAVASTASLTTNTGKTITSVALTAGDWEVSGAVHFVPANTTTVTNLIAGISATDNTQPSTDLLGGYAERGAGYTAAGTVWNTVTVAPTRIALTATTTYYLVATAVFGASTCTGHGFIRAVRVR